MAALSEWAKENKRRRTREWYAKAKAAGTLKPKMQPAKSRAIGAISEDRIRKQRECDRRFVQNRGPTYQTWRAMHKRCEYPQHKNFHLYGGRGITICDAWKSYETFLSDMSERPQGLTLDRININGNYEKSNCRWATPKEQAQNRRTRVEAAKARRESSAPTARDNTQSPGKPQRRES